MDHTVPFHAIARGNSYDEATAFLREQYPTLFLEEPVRRRYNRSQTHQQGLWERHKREIAEGGRVQDYGDYQQIPLNRLCDSSDALALWVGRRRHLVPRERW
jgi:hypothetical protein